MLALGPALLARGQGLTLVHYQLNASTFRPMRWGASLVSLTKTAQVEQTCGRV